MSEPIGFIGLGHLGLPLATHLLERGHPLAIYNRTASKADPLVARGARVVARPADAVTPGGIVVSILWDDASVEELVASPDFLARLGPGGIHVSMSTISPAAARRCAARHAAAGSTYVEAPVFGRPEAAVARQLWIPFAGPAAATARVQPLLVELGAQGTFDFGEQIGAATTVKIVGNFLLVAARHALREGLGMAAKTGVDPKAVIDMLTASLFPAPIYQSYGARIAANAAPPAVSPIPLKDVGMFERIASEAGSPTAMSHLLLELIRGEMVPVSAARAGAD